MSDVELPSDEVFWSSDGFANPGPQGLSLELLNAARGSLSRVVGLGTAAETAETTPLRVALLALEIYDTGALLTFRATEDRTDDQPLPYLTWITAVSDDRATPYRTVSGSEARHGLWRGEVLIYPAPPVVAATLQIDLTCRGTFTDSWDFAVDLS